MTRVETMLRELDTAGTRSDVTWTTGNVAEAFPGVFSTFGMSFGFAPMIPEDVEDC